MKLSKQFKEKIDKCKVLSSENGKCNVWWFDVLLKNGKREGKWIMDEKDLEVSKHYLDSDTVDILPSKHAFNNSCLKTTQ